MNFTIITPTIQRVSLLACCESVNAQTYPHWRHVVMVDRDIPDVNLLESIAHEQRLILHCDTEHRNYGNTCRHNAWEHATKDSYLIGLDDDNLLLDSTTLGEIAYWLKMGDYPAWAIFPIFRHGQIFFNDPPGLCRTDTLNVVVRWEVGRWPDMPDYTADGHWVEALKANHRYAAFPNARPIGLMEKSSEGK